ncbi:MAG: single-stranded-DNA-specific exonuclease RecJ [Defluviitaleaceae bacterium]|nr:single-stranded-DNA-specific exonuclease RecJ [Defluviitaleaceae bacterium]
MSIWEIKKETADLKLMSEILNIDEITAQILVNRGIRTKNTAIKFLNPKLEFQNDEGTMKDMKKAAELLKKYIKDGKKIVIYGDYDVDGVTSTVILYKTIKNFGGEVSYYIPIREEDGYGLNKSSIASLREKGAEVIIACDNGTSAVEEIEYAKSLGVSVVIIDHHELEIAEDEAIFPNADAFVNPKRPDCEYPFKLMCAGGLCFKFAKYFHKYMKTEFSLHDELLVMAALATFCDIVDLFDENRVFAKNGLDILNSNKQINRGLYALIKERNISDKEITEFHIGFIIGPCINATGRLEQAERAVELLLTESDERAEELAVHLVELNEERKLLTNVETDKVMNALKEAPLDKVIVFYDDEIHESIAGIIAGRVKERMYRPTFVLTSNGDAAKGSGRSIEGYNMQRELCECADILERFGGHPMAAGLTILPENIDELRNRLNKNCLLTGDDFTEKILIDHKLDISDITFRLAKNIDIMAPFGKGNRQPFFVTYSLKVLSVKAIEAKNTVIFTLSDMDEKKRIKAVLFENVDVLKEKLLGIFDTYDTQKVLAGILRHTTLCMDAVYNIDINEYNGDVSVQMKIKDYNVYSQ